MLISAATNIIPRRAVGQAASLPVSCTFVSARSLRLCDFAINAVDAAPQRRPELTHSLGCARYPPPPRSIPAPADGLFGYEAA